MTADFPVIIYHDPASALSRAVVATAEQAGCAPGIVRIPVIGWTRPLLRALLAAMDAAPRDILRDDGPAAEAGLLDPHVSDADILDAMVARPGLVERPIVVSPLGVALCRSIGTVPALLNRDEMARVAEGYGPRLPEPRNAQAGPPVLVS